MLSCWYGDLTLFMLVWQFNACHVRRDMLSCWYGVLTLVMLV